MSKAFAREIDDPDEGEQEPALELPQGTRNYITPGGYARIKGELEHLLRTERPQVVETVHWAASNGDRSENGDYIYGKRRLREIDRRIRFLTRRLDQSEVIDPACRENVDQIFFGATVTLREAQGPEQIYQIVGVDETDFQRGRISWVSPLARAMLRAREGEVVRYKCPSGWREVEVLEVDYRNIEP